MLAIVVMVLLVMLLQPVVPQQLNVKECNSYWFYEIPPVTIMDLFLKFEQALMEDVRGLEHMRTYFLAARKFPAVIGVDLQVTNVTNQNYYYSQFPTLTFCRQKYYNNYVWITCKNCDFTFKYSPMEPGSFESTMDRKKVYYSASLLAALHSNLLSLYMNSFLDYAGMYEDDENLVVMDLTLKLGNMTCNPDCDLTKCVLAELISWIKVYSFSYPARPTKWDTKDRGAVELSTGPWYNYIPYDPNPLKFLSWNLDDNQYHWLSFAEFLAVSISLAMVIGKLLPSFHDRIVSKVTRVEHRSLYWGAVVVSNIFVYGLLLLGMRGMAIFVTLIYSYNNTWWVVMMLLILHELFIILILVIASVVASKQFAVDNVKIRHGVMVVVRLSFLITFFCCCTRSCSMRSRRRAERALVLFSFMSFVYHSVMDIISFVFVLLIETLRAPMVTFSLLYVSLVVFLMFLVSFTLLSLLKNQAESRSSHCKQLLNCCATTFLLFLVSCGVILLMVMYLIIIISLNLQGLTGIATGLIPTVILSAGSWYIKEKVLRSSDITNGSVPETINQGQRDEEDEDGGELTSDHDERMIVP